jgi:hypothetical protein
VRGVLANHPKWDKRAELYRQTALKAGELALLLGECNRMPAAANEDPGLFSVAEAEVRRVGELLAPFRAMTISERRRPGRKKTEARRLAWALRYFGAIFGWRFTPLETLCVAVMAGIEPPCATRDAFDLAQARWKKMLQKEPELAPDAVSKKVVATVPTLWGTNSPRRARVRGPFVRE